jgi:hypothetical protein
MLRDCEIDAQTGLRERTVAPNLPNGNQPARQKAFEASLPEMFASFPSLPSSHSAALATPLNRYNGKI